MQKKIATRFVLRRYAETFYIEVLSIHVFQNFVSLSKNNFIPQLNFFRCLFRAIYQWYQIVYFECHLSLLQITCHYKDFCEELFVFYKTWMLKKVNNNNETGGKVLLPQK